MFTWGACAAGQSGAAPAGAAADQPKQLAVLRGLDVKALACGAEVGPECAVGTSDCVLVDAKDEELALFGAAGSAAEAGRKSSHKAIM